MNAEAQTDAEVMRSVLPYRWSSNDRYQILHGPDGKVGLAYKPIASGRQYIWGSIIVYGVVCPAFFIGFWFLTRTWLVLLPAVAACVFGPLMAVSNWQTDNRRRREGPIWSFDPATGMFANNRLGVSFHRDELRAIQLLSFHNNQMLNQEIFVVDQPDGQLPRRYLIRVVNDAWWFESLAMLRRFLEATGCASVPMWKHKPLVEPTFKWWKSKK